MSALPSRTPAELRADALVIEQSAELMGALDEVRSRLAESLKIADVDALRSLLAGPLLIAARGTLDRLDSSPVRAADPGAP